MTKAFNGRWLAKKTTTVACGSGRTSHTLRQTNLVTGSVKCHDVPKSRAEWLHSGMHLRIGQQEVDRNRSAFGSMQCQLHTLMRESFPLVVFFYCLQFFSLTKIWPLPFPFHWASWSRIYHLNSWIYFRFRPLFTTQTHGKVTNNQLSRSCKSTSLNPADDLIIL